MELKDLAHQLIEPMQEFYKDPENERKFREWKEKHELQGKQKGNRKTPNQSGLSVSG